MAICAFSLPNWLACVSESSGKTTDIASVGLGMADDEVKALSVMAVLRGGIGHGNAFRGHFPGADVQCEAVGMRLAENPHTVGQSNLGNCGRRYRLGSSAGCPAGSHCQQEKPDEGLFDSCGHLLSCFVLTNFDEHNPRLLQVGCLVVASSTYSHPDALPDLA